MRDSDSMPNRPALDLRPGITDPVMIVISRRQVEEADLDSVMANLRLLSATREDVRRYRGQAVLTVDGYNDDNRELVDIASVRALLKSMYQSWPYFAFFLNQVDDSIKLLASCACGAEYLGGGAVRMDAGKLGEFMHTGFDGINIMCEKHGFSEQELEVTVEGFAQYMNYLT